MKYSEITDFIKTYSTSEEEFKLYFGLFESGINLIFEIFEKGQTIPYMEKILEDIDSLIKEEVSDPKITWEEIKNYPSE